MNVGSFQATQVLSVSWVLHFLTNKWSRCSVRRHEELWLTLPLVEAELHEIIPGILLHGHYNQGMLRQSSWLYMRLHRETPINISGSIAVLNATNALTSYNFIGRPVCSSFWPVEATCSLRLCKISEVLVRTLVASQRRCDLVSKWGCYCWRVSCLHPIFLKQACLRYLYVELSFCVVSVCTRSR